MSKSFKDLMGYISNADLSKIEEYVDHSHMDIHSGVEQGISKHSIYHTFA